MKLIFFDTAFHMETESCKSCQFYAVFDNQQEVDGFLVGNVLNITGEKLSHAQEKLIMEALKDRGYK